LVSKGETGLLSFTHCFLVFFFSSLLLLHDALHYLVPEVSSEAVETGIGVDGEVVLDFCKFIRAILVLLREGDISQAIYDLDIIEGFDDWHGEVQTRLVESPSDGQSKTAAIVA
jgi:hypothetical protein